MDRDTVTTRNSVASHVRSLALMGRPQVDIVLAGQTGTLSTSYTTGDGIQGEVVIATAHDTRFDRLEISLEGLTKTFVERMMPATAGARTEAQHVFLSMQQPVDESIYPQPRILETGRTYRFPFTFVVPGQLLPHVCKHECASGQVHEAHLRLPPSLGETSVASNGKVLLDDLAPEMSKVVYSIRARLSSQRERDGRDVTVAEGSRKIRIVPASEEDPPLQVAADRSSTGPGSLSGAMYQLRKHKDMKKGLFKGRLGTLSVEAAQSKGLVLPPPQSEAPSAPSTMVTVLLRFDPADDSSTPPPPPGLGQLTCRLKAHTYYGTSSSKGFPDNEGGSTGAPGTTYQFDRGCFSETVPLSSRCVESARWELHGTEHDHVDHFENHPLRQDSTLSGSSYASSAETSSFPAPTPSYRGGSFYTAKILVPVTLPDHKAWVPTFHSCLVSRVYVLELSLGAHAPGSSGGGSASLLKGGSSGINLNLRVPVQILSSSRTAGGSIGDPATALTVTTTGGQASDVDAEVNALFQPRIISPPARSISEPPIYDVEVDFGSGSSGSSGGGGTIGSSDEPETRAFEPCSSATNENDRYRFVSQGKAITSRNARISSSTTTTTTITTELLFFIPDEPESADEESH